MKMLIAIENDQYAWNLAKTQPRVVHRPYFLYGRSNQMQL